MPAGESTESIYIFIKLKLKFQTHVQREKNNYTIDKNKGNPWVQLTSVFFTKNKQFFYIVK